MSIGNKKVILAVLVVLVVIFFALALKCTLDNRNQDGKFRQEIARRMDLEAKAASFEREKSEILAKLRKAEQELEEKKEALESAQRDLSHEKLINRSLKKELDKIGRPGEFSMEGEQ